MHARNKDLVGARQEQGVWCSQGAAGSHGARREQRSRSALIGNNGVGQCSSGAAAESVSDRREQRSRSALIGSSGVGCSPGQRQAGRACSRCGRLLAEAKGNLQQALARRGWTGWAQGRTSSLCDDPLSRSGRGGYGGTAAWRRKWSSELQCSIWSSHGPGVSSGALTLQISTDTARRRRVGSSRLSSHARYGAPMLRVYHRISHAIELPC